MNTNFINTLSNINIQELWISFLNNFLYWFLVSYDYIYIYLLKYIFFIYDNYILYFSITIPWTIFLYFFYKKMTYQERSFFWYIFVILLLPITFIIYLLLCIHIFIEKYIYYKIFWINYLLDVPRKKRDYVLEYKIREELKKQVTSLSD